MAKTITDAAKIARIAVEGGWDYRPHYSSPGLSGVACPGIVCGPSEIGRVKAAAIRAGIKEPISVDDEREHCVVYWPFIRTG